MIQIAHTTVNSGFFIGGTHVLTPFDGSQNHGHQFRGVAPVEETVEEKPVETPAEKPVKTRKTRAKKAE